MNQITRSLIIFLSLIFTQARASYVLYQENDVGKEVDQHIGFNEELTAQLTSQASLLTQYAIADVSMKGEINRRVVRCVVPFYERDCNCCVVLGW
jgi:hypothetical protein